LARKSGEAVAKSVNFNAPLKTTFALTLITLTRPQKNSTLETQEAANPLFQYKKKWLNAVWFAETVMQNIPLQNSNGSSGAQKTAQCMTHGNIQTNSNLTSNQRRQQP